MDSILKVAGRADYSFPGPRVGSFHVKPVPSRADGADDIRLTFASNEVTQAPHVDVYRASFHDGVRTPDLIDDLLTRKRAVRVFHQEPKEPKFCRAKVDVPAIARYPEGRQIHHYLSLL